MSNMVLTEQLVAQFERFEEDPGPDAAGMYLSDDDYRATAETLAAKSGSNPPWVFAYGSLIWNPAFNYVERRSALLHGWHRSFCLEIRRWRGSPTQPGLMLGLRPGGSCRGIAYRLSDNDRVGQIERLLRREVSRQSSLSTFRVLELTSPEGRINALTFWTVGPKFPYVVTKPHQEVAAILARACGHLGSGARYLHNTVKSLEAQGIRDRNLWCLQRLVAAELLAMHSNERQF